MTTITLPRTHIRVVRSDGREWPSMAIAFRELIGTPTELGGSEHQRIRSSLRSGAPGRDRHGFTWSSVGGTVAEESIAWTDFTFGVEIELLAPFEMAQMSVLLAPFAGWRVVRDGSLQSVPGFHGMECVSPILQGDTGQATLKAVMDAIHAAGCRVNASCGLHVHIGVRGMKVSRLRKIAIAFVNAECNFDALVPPARRVSRYARSNSAQLSSRSAAQLAGAMSVSTLGAVMNGGNSSQHYNPYRYYKLNFQSFVHHGTIEFRQHSGTVESAKAAAWVRLVTGFCAAAAAAEQQVVAPNSVPFESFLAATTRGDAVTARFLNGRRAKFSGQRALAA